MIGGILIAAALSLNVGQCVKDPGGMIYKIMQKDQGIVVLATTDGTNRVIGIPEEVVEQQGTKVDCPK